MSERSIIEDKMQKKIKEIQSLEDKLKGAKFYVKALEDVLKAIDKGIETKSSDSESPLRKGSLVTQAHDVIMKRGHPVHIDDLIVAIGREVTRETKASLTGSIAAYVRREEIFTRPAPNTFGLVELDHYESNDQEVDEPPEGFGKGNYSNTDDEIPF